MLDREVRTITTEPIRIERRADGKAVLRGYAAVFDQVSEEIWGFREKIARGAFADVLRDDVRALFNHDPNFVLGRSPATLTLREDERGLLMENEPPDTQWARDLVVAIERGDITGQSFSFSMDWDDDAAESWDQDGDQVLRTIRKISRLWDVGPVTFPAYPQTDVQVSQRMVVPDRVRDRARQVLAPAGRSVELARKRLNLLAR